MTLEDRIVIFKKISIYFFILSFLVSFSLITLVLSLIFMEGNLVEVKIYVALFCSIFIATVLTFTFYTHMKNIDEIDDLITKFCNSDNHDCRIVTLMKIIIMVANFCFFKKKIGFNEEDICSREKQNKDGRCYKN